MRSNACLLATMLLSCATADSGGDGGGPPLDLSVRGKTDLGHPPDFSRVAPLDLTSPAGADLLDTGDLSGVARDGAAGQDLATAQLDMRLVPDAAVPPDLSMTMPPDLSMVMPPDLSMPPDLAQSDGGVVCHVLVNEFMTGDQNSSNDEFVEFYNPCLNAADLVNYALVYRNPNNVSGIAVANDNVSISFGNVAGVFVVPGKGYLTACSALYNTYYKILTGKPCDASYGAGALADKAGAVGLRDGANALVDSVGYGTVAMGNAFIKVAAAPAPAITFIGSSVGRIPSGVDTGDNSKDWKATQIVTIDAPNQ